ncbi:MAG: ornithine carbamoyltransferase [Candidatus Thorarchaeota archaeon]
MTLRGRNVLTLHDFSAAEIEKIVDLSVELKARPRQTLDGNRLVMIFMNPSTRTQISFESAMSELGGVAYSHGPSALQLAHGETFQDTGRVLSRYVHGVVIRNYGGPYGTCHATLKEVAEGASIPVINGADDFEHPTQALADLLTLKELGNMKEKKIAFVWGWSKRPRSIGLIHSWLNMAAKVGLKFSLGYPKGYEPDSEVMKWVEEDSDKSGADISYHTDMEEAVADADIVYVKNWRNIRTDVEDEKRFREGKGKDLNRWIVTADLMKHAKPDAKFMHCLPIERGFEVADDVADGTQSIIWDQAENRFHINKGLLTAIMGKGE